MVADEKKEQSVAELMQLLLAFAGAAVHYQEFIDSGESVDLLAAKTSLHSYPSVREWADRNAVMLPVRRDGRSMFDAIK